MNVAGEILTLDASHCHALDNVLGKEQVYDDNREDRECNRYIHLTHIKLQEVCGTQLSRSGIGNVFILSSCRTSAGVK